jgi:hypothetical protein
MPTSKAAGRYRKQLNSQRFIPKVGRRFSSGSGRACRTCNRSHRIEETAGGSHSFAARLPSELPAPALATCRTCFGTGHWAGFSDRFGQRRKTACKQFLPPTAGSAPLRLRRLTLATSKARLPPAVGSLPASRGACRRWSRLAGHHPAPG